MTGRRYPTLDAAFEALGTPQANRGMIRQFTSALGITAFIERSGHIRAERSDGLLALEIHYGYTNGFQSRDEIMGAMGDLISLLGHEDVWPSQRARDTWGLTHPVNGLGKADSTKGSGQERDYGTCHRCNHRHAANGTCECD